MYNYGLTGGEDYVAPKITIVTDGDRKIETRDDQKYLVQNYKVNSNKPLKSYKVSIDSFTLGIVLCIKHHNLLVAGLSFSIVSFLFTLLGLFLGKYLGEKTGKFSKIIGIIILFIFTIKYLFNL